MQLIYAYYERKKGYSKYFSYNNNVTIYIILFIITFKCLWGLSIYYNTSQQTLNLKLINTLGLYNLRCLKILKPFKTSFSQIGQKLKWMSHQQTVQKKRHAIHHRIRLFPKHLKIDATEWFNDGVSWHSVTRRPVGILYFILYIEHNFLMETIARAAIILIVDLSPVSDVGPTPHSRTAPVVISWGGSQIRRRYFCVPKWPVLPTTKIIFLEKNIKYFLFSLSTTNILFLEKNIKAVFRYQQQKLFSSKGFKKKKNNVRFILKKENDYF